MRRGTQPGRMEGADAFPTRKGRAISWLEPCLGERRRPRLDEQGPLSQLKAMGSTAGVRGESAEAGTAGAADASTTFAGWWAAAELYTRNMLSPVFLALRCSKTLPTNTWEASGSSLA